MIWFVYENEMLAYLLLGISIILSIIFFILSTDFNPQLSNHRKNTSEHDKYDEITGFLNRNAFIEQINNKIEEEGESKLAVIYLDIDHFQKVNNSMNHHAGDQVLQELSCRIDTVLSQNKCYAISRISGDEFGILLPCNDKQKVEMITNALLSDIKKIIEISDFEFQVSASIGIAIYPYDGDNANTLMKNAEIAMFQAKKERNSYKFFKPFTDELLNNKLYLESELRKAIKNKEFVLYYQPQVNSRTNELTGMEALLRWQHPKHGIITPDKFIPIAEETNLIVDIGKWGIKEALTQLKEWHNKGYKQLRISINLSISQLKDEGFLDYIQESIKAIQIQSKFVTFEITESMTMDYQSIIPVLQKLKQLGFIIAIDDFGTGYASLSYIKRLPFDILKIDRSFIKDMEQNHISLSIIEMIISLAKKLGVDIIAEGIETREQLELLKRKGCKKIQGYYYSKPLPANQFDYIVSNIRNIP